MTTQHQEPIEKSYEFAEKTLFDLKEDAIPAWPELYEVLYSHMSGQYQGVTESIDKALEQHGKLDAGVLLGIHERYFSCDRSFAVTDEVGSKISEEIRKVLVTMKSAGTRSDKYEKALKQIEDRCSDVKSPEQLHGMVKILSELTASIAKNNRSLNSRLNRSAEQISILHEDLEKARSESNTDALTGLSNRKKFDTSIKRAIHSYRESKQVFTLLLIDIDHFKRFNDTFGHQTGDQVLRLVSHTLKVNLKGGDTAARYGGEEFAIILPNTKKEDAFKVAEQVREAVMSKELVKRSTGENLGRITISLGVAEVRLSDCVTAIIERADQALYSAKEAGRNQTILAPEDDLEGLQNIA